MMIILNKNLPRFLLMGSFSLIVIYYVALGSLYGGMLNFDIEVEYEGIAELIKRLLFSGDVQGMPAYCLSQFGVTCDLNEGHFSSLIDYERPLFFVYLSVLKLFSHQTFYAHFYLSLILIVTSAFIVSKALVPDNFYTLWLLGSLLVAPFYIYQSFNQQPHIPQLFLTSIGLYFYVKKRFALAFLALSLTVPLHPGNLPLLGCFGLHFIFENRLNWRPYVHVAVGGMGALVLTEGFLFILFESDSMNLFPHQFFTEKMLFDSQRFSGDFLKSDAVAEVGGLSYFKNSLIFMPLGTLGIFWLKSFRQFFICTLPFLVYFVATDFSMPGTHRVLLPAYFLSYMFFLHNFMNEKRAMSRGVVLVIIAASVVLTFAYHVLADGPIIKRGLPVAIDESISSSDRSQLHWNLMRFTTVDPGASIVYSVEDAPVTDKPNIASPFRIYPYLFVSAAAYILPSSLFIRIDSKKGWSVGGSKKIIQYDRK